MEVGKGTGKVTRFEIAKEKRLERRLEKSHDHV